MAEKIDLRLDVGFPKHPKTIELIGELGLDGAWALLTLWCHCRQYRPSGDLTGKSDAYIEGAAGWPLNRRGAFIAALCAAHYLDGDENFRVLHDWDDHQRWAMGSDERSKNSRIAALIKNGRTREEAEKILIREEKRTVRTAVKKAANRTAEFDFPHTPASASLSLTDTLSAPDTLSQAVAADAAQPKEGSAAAENAAAPQPRQLPPLPPGGLNGHHHNGIPAAELLPAESDEPNTPGAAVWEAYEAAYLQRYGVKPARNGKGNRHCADIAKRIPAADAPHVAAWFVGHPKAYYVSRTHALDCLLADCEGLHTQWATNRRTTAAAASAEDRTASSPFAKMAHEARQREALEARNAEPASK